MLTKIKNDEFLLHKVGALIGAIVGVIFGMFISSKADKVEERYELEVEDGPEED